MKKSCLLTIFVVLLGVAFGGLSSDQSTITDQTFPAESNLTQNEMLPPLPPPVLDYNSDGPDFDGDLTSDILWHRSSNTAHFVTLVDAAVPGAFNYVGGGDDAAMVIVEVGGDFDGDGTTDLLWKRMTSNAYFVTLMDGVTPGPYMYVGGINDPDIRITGIGDFDGDGTTDLLWQRYSKSNSYYYTLMTDGVPGEFQSVGRYQFSWFLGLSGTQYVELVEVGDFNGNGTCDLLELDTLNSIYYFTPLPGVVESSTVITADPDISVIDTGDFNGDGTTDLLWHRESSNAYFVTLFDGVSFEDPVLGEFQYVGGGGDPDMSIISVGDFDGDATTDLLWSRASNSAYFITLVDNAVPGAYQYAGGGADPDIEIFELSDFDGDATTDIMWRRKSNNAHFITLVDAAVPGTFQYAGGGADHDIKTLNLDDKLIYDLDVELTYVPGGTFQMGDSFGEGAAIELPVHEVTLDSFYISKHEITNGQYCDYLNAAIADGLITIVDGIVYAVDDTNLEEPYFDTEESSAFSQISYESITVPSYFTPGDLTLVNGIIAGDDRIMIDTYTFMVRNKGYRNMTNDPVVMVSWFGAKAFCDYYGYNMITEAQWEYAARGGLEGKRFPLGDTITHNQANYLSSGDDVYDVSPIEGNHPIWNDGIEPFTCPVGSIPASVNGFGLHGMAGNVWGWCADWIDAFPSEPVTNPTGPETGESRVIRGGGWSSVAYHCRVALRNYIPPNVRFYNMGFRVCLDAE